MGLKLPLSLEDIVRLQMIVCQLIYVGQQLELDREMNFRM